MSARLRRTRVIALACRLFAGRNVSLDTFEDAGGPDRRPHVAAIRVRDVPVREQPWGDGATAVAALEALHAELVKRLRERVAADEAAVAQFGAAL